ncbi:hypothetical protein BH10PLA2_BH10PLA2_39330 [soil metagenome]
MHVGRLTYLISPSARKGLRWRLLLVLGILCLPLLSTGCICLSFGGWGGHETGEHCDGDHPDTNGAVTQKGTLTSGNGEPVTVYYPVPFASPPNLEIRDQFNKCRIIEQRADSFKVVQDGPIPPSVHWTARGVTTSVAAPGITPTVVTASAPANEAQPVVPASFGR